MNSLEKIGMTLAGYIENLPTMKCRYDIEFNL